MKAYMPEITQRFLLIRDEVIRDGLCNTAAEFAKEVGEYPQNFSKMEKGSRFPTLDHIARACEKYNYNANWVMLNSGSKKMDKRQEVPIEKRVSDLEIQVRSLKKIVSVGKK